MLQFPPLLPDSLLPLLHWRQFAEDLAAATAFGKKRRKKRKKNFPKSKAKECGGGLLLRIYTKKRLALLLDQSVSLKKKEEQFFFRNLSWPTALKKTAEKLCVSSYVFFTTSTSWHQNFYIFKVLRRKENYTPSTRHATLRCQKRRFFWRLTADGGAAVEALSILDSIGSPHAPIALNFRSRPPNPCFPALVRGHKTLWLSGHW